MDVVGILRYISTNAIINQTLFVIASGIKRHILNIIQKHAAREVPVVNAVLLWWYCFISNGLSWLLSAATTTCTVTLPPYHK